VITLRHNKRAMVKKLDFRTSGGHLEGGDSRARMRFPGRGPTAVITDLGIMTPDPVTKELTLTSIHPGVQVEKVVENTGWQLLVDPNLKTTELPTETELSVLRDLQARTARAHAGLK
jgi:glutaconate CoA-transferase subunit B